MYVLNDVTSKSREQRLVTKEYIATHKNLILPVYTPDFSDKTFKSSVLCRNSYCNVHYRPVFFYKICNLHSTPTFKTESLRIFDNVQLVKWLLL